MEHDETSDVEEDIYRSKDRVKKSSKSRKQSSKESATKKDGSKSKYGSTMYVCSQLLSQSEVQADNCLNLL